MAIGAHRAYTRRGSVTEDEVNSGYGEVGQQALRAFMNANQLYRLWQAKRRLEQSIRDQLRQNHDDANDQLSWPHGPPAHGFHKLAVQTQDPVDVAVDDPADVGEDKRASGTDE